MSATIEFNSTELPERVLRLVLAAAEQWKCTPGEAAARLLDQLAKNSGFQKAA